LDVSPEFWTFYQHAVAAEAAMAISQSSGGTIHLAAIVVARQYQYVLQLYFSLFRYFYDVILVFLDVSHA
jgi:hypothetical protein